MKRIGRLHVLITIILISIVLSTAFALTASRISGSFQSNGKIVYKPEYVVYEESSMYYAQAANGNIAFSSTNATTVINYAIGNLTNGGTTSGGTIFLKAGTYSNTTAAQQINPHGYDNIILEGEGDSTVINGLCLIIGSNWEVRNLKFVGSPSPSAVFFSAYGSNIENVTCENILFDSLGMSTSAGFEVYMHLSRTVQNLEFIDCKAVNCSGRLFWYEEDPDYISPVVKDVWFTRCQAINCGRYANISDWVCGFDFEGFSNTTTIENVFFTDCLAKGSWREGFHFEFAPIKKNIILSGCVAEDNGQVGRGVGSPNVVWYAFGYLLSSGISAINCISRNCSGAGFYFKDTVVNDTVTITNCKDYNSYIGILSELYSGGTAVIDGFCSYNATYLPLYLVAPGASDILTNILVDGKPYVPTQPQPT
jgi:hypothetical protein